MRQTLLATEIFRPGRADGPPLADDARAPSGSLPLSFCAPPGSAAEGPPAPSCKVKYPNAYSDSATDLPMLESVGHPERTLPPHQLISYVRGIACRRL